MFLWLTLRSWLDIVLGFLFGVISTVFVIKIQNQLKKNISTQVPISILMFYSSSMAVATLLYAVALSGGLLEEWQRLQFQRGRERAVKILDIGFIQGKSGIIYMDNQGILERVDPIHQNNSNFPVVPTKNNCGALFFLPIFRADFIDSKSACLGFGSTDVKVAYAIDSRGYAYLWRHKAHEFGVIENLVITFIGGTVSFVLGAIVLQLLISSKMLKEKMQKNAVQSDSAV